MTRNVEFELPLMSENDCPVETVFVNGMRVEINKGESVTGKPIYKEILRESRKFEGQANKTVNKVINN